MNSRLNKKEECISDLEDKLMEITQSQHIERQILKKCNILHSVWQILGPSMSLQMT